MCSRTMVLGIVCGASVLQQDMAICELGPVELALTLQIRRGIPKNAGEHLECRDNH
jgi:hypothetical protein